MPGTNQKADIMSDVSDSAYRITQRLTSDFLLTCQLAVDQFAYEQRRDAGLVGAGVRAAQQGIGRPNGT